MIGKAGDPVSHIAQAYPDRVEVRGRDLTGDLMGRLTFTEYFHLLLTGDEPTADQRDFLDLLLISIAEHGMMPTNVAARMTLAADPGSLQGAVAAGILGCGPVILGTAEECARLLARRRATPREIARAIRTAAGKLPGFGHPVHKPLDPRAERILELADARGVSGAHVAMARALRDAVTEAWGRAADDERLAADRRRDARPRLPGRDGQGRADPRPHREPARPPGRGAGAAGRLPDGGRRRGGDPLRATTPRSREQLAYLLERSAFYRAKGIAARRRSTRSRRCR